LVDCEAVVDGGSGDPKELSAEVIKGIIIGRGVLHWMNKAVKA
jgi:hypothetical protein